MHSISDVFLEAVFKQNLAAYFEADLEADCGADFEADCLADIEADFEEDFEKDLEVDFDAHFEVDLFCIAASFFCFLMLSLWNLSTRMFLKGELVMISDFCAILFLPLPWPENALGNGEISKIDTLWTICK